MQGSTKGPVSKGVQTVLTNYMKGSTRGKKQRNNKKEKLLSPYSLPRPPENL